MRLQQWHKSLQHLRSALDEDPDSELAAENLEELIQYFVREFGTDWEQHIKQLAAESGEDDETFGGAGGGDFSAGGGTRLPGGGERRSGDIMDGFEPEEGSADSTPTDLWKAVLAALSKSGHVVEQLSDSPDVRQVKHFLSDEECDRLVRAHDELHERDEVARETTQWCFNRDRWGLLERLGISLPGGGDQWCTDSPKHNKKFFSKEAGLAEQLSTSIIVPPGHSRAIDEVERRITNEVGLPPRFAWSNQLLKYRPGHAYAAHTDCFTPSEGEILDVEPPQRDRAATVLIYLSDVEDGGETAFPQIGLDVKPEKGKLIVWLNLLDDAHCNIKSQHLARAVGSGTKYVFQKWFDFKAVGARLEGTRLTDTVFCDPVDCRYYIHPKAEREGYDAFVRLRDRFPRLSAVQLVDGLLAVTRADPYSLLALNAMGQQVARALKVALSAGGQASHDLSQLARRVPDVLDRLNTAVDYLSDLEKGSTVELRLPLPAVNVAIDEIEELCVRLNIDSWSGELHGLASEGPRHDDDTNVWKSASFKSSSDPQVKVEVDANGISDSITAVPGLPRGYRVDDPYADHTAAGIALDEAGLVEEGLRSFEAAVAAAERVADARTLSSALADLGVSLMHAERYQLAMERLEQAIEVDGENDLARENLDELKRHLETVQPASPPAPQQSNAETGKEFTRVWRATGQPIAEAAGEAGALVLESVEPLLSALAPPSKCRGVRRSAKRFVRAFDVDKDQLRRAAEDPAAWEELADAVEQLRSICK